MIEFASMQYFTFGIVTFLLGATLGTYGVLMAGKVILDKYNDLRSDT